MTMVDERTTSPGEPEPDPVLDAMAEVRAQLDCVAAGLDALEAQQPDEICPPPGQ